MEALNNVDLSEFVWIRWLAYDRLQVNLKCNAETQLVVNEPTQTGGPSVVLSLAEAFVDSTVGNTSASGSPLAIPPGVEIPLQVDMRVTAADLRLGFPPGTYTYKVTLTVAP